MELTLVNQRITSPVNQDYRRPSVGETVEFTEIEAVTEVRSNRSFVEANTQAVSLLHLKKRMRNTHI
jgi:hypothetical protein